jgi:hypothetical protein
MVFISGSAKKAINDVFQLGGIDRAASNAVTPAHGRLQKQSMNEPAKTAISNKINP